MKRILLIQTAFIGDVILATPVIEKLHQFFPKAEIDILVRKGNEPLFHQHPILHEVVVWEKRKRKYWNLVALIRSLRKRKYDLAVNMQRFMTTGLITILAGAKETAGFDKNPLSFMFSKKIHHQQGSAGTPIHEVERNLSLIAAWTDHTFLKPKLYPSKIGPTARYHPGEYICVAPTSVWFTKQFPAGKWVDLIDRVGGNIRIILLGGPGDFARCQRIKELTKHPEVTNLAGKLSLLESSALMKRAKMNYVNDSAPLHLASAVNAPVIAIFCSTAPHFGFTPLSDISFVVEIDEKLDCRPCGLHGKSACPKGHFKCSDIDVDKLLDKLS